jgi:hypothetical protein
MLSFPFSFQELLLFLSVSQSYLTFYQFHRAISLSFSFFGLSPFLSVSQSYLTFFQFHRAISLSFSFSDLSHFFLVSQTISLSFSFQIILLFLSGSLLEITVTISFCILASIFLFYFSAPTNTSLYLFSTIFVTCNSSFDYIPCSLLFLVPFLCFFLSSFYLFVY